MPEDLIAQERPDLVLDPGPGEDLLQHAVRLFTEAVGAQDPPAFLSQKAYEVLVSLEQGRDAQVA